MTSNRYPHLLSPGRIGTLELKNRIAVTAMGVSLSEEDGTVGEKIIAYHEEQARGGAGLIISGVTGPMAVANRRKLLPLVPNSAR